MSTDAPTTPSHQAVDRALQVLALLGSRPIGASLQEIAETTGVPKPSLHRTLLAMRARGFAVQRASGGVYLLGPAALEAAFTFHAGLDLRRLMHPLAAEVSDHFQQTSHVAILDGAHVTYVDKVEAPIGIRLSSVIGGRNPAHATGVGKALLTEALSDQATTRRWVEEHGPLVARTAHTVTSYEGLAKELDEARTRGWTVDDEESEEGLLCVAAPVPLVFGQLGPSVAVSVTGLRSSLVEYGIERAGRELLALINTFEFGVRQSTTPTNQTEGL